MFKAFKTLLFKKSYVGDWGLGIGDCNPQSPIPNPQNYFIIKLVLVLILINIDLTNY